MRTRHECILSRTLRPYGIVREKKMLKIDFSVFFCLFHLAVLNSRVMEPDAENRANRISIHWK